MRRISKVIKSLIPSIILVLILSAFSFPGLESVRLEQDDGTTPAATVPAGITKDEIDTSLTSYMKLAWGDSLRLGILERPFTATDMEYHPETDLVGIMLSEDDNYYYFSLELNDVDSSVGYPSANYAIEFDVDKDLKGDYLLWVSGDDSTEWNHANVNVLQDVNRDVGGAMAVIPDAGAGDGYETVVFSPDVTDQADLAWKRVDPETPNVVQLAINKSMLEPGQFFWKAWTDGNMIEAGLFDFNDFYNNSEAGSPDLDSADYPVNQLNLMDSTCWVAYNFEASGKELGGCYQLAPEPTKAPATQTPCSGTCNTGTSQRCCTCAGWEWTADGCRLIPPF